MTQINPSLLIADRKAFRAPQVPTGRDPKVTLWCNRQGVVAALSHVVNQERWLHILGVASYKLDENPVLAVPWQYATREAIIEEFQSTVWPTFLQLHGCEVLHGSAVIGDRGVVAFCAASETGKSTLAYALSRRGYGLWADDAVVLEMLPRSVQTRPLSFFVRLRRASALYFGYPEAQLNRGRVECEGSQREDVLPLTSVCLLEQVETLSNDKAVTIQRLTGAGAVAGVLDHAVYFSLQDQRRKRHMIKRYLNLVGQVPVFKVCLCRGLERVPAILDELERRILSPAFE